MHLDRRTLLRTVALALAAGCSPATRKAQRATPSPPAGSATSATGAAPNPSAATSSPAGPAPAGRPGGPAVEVRAGPRTTPSVALTFHGAGEPALATALLAEVERAGARITVLAVGSWLDGAPAMARRILGGGHELGNHTYTHPVLPRLDATAAYEEIARCAAVLRRLTGGPGRWFRPSGTPTATPLIAAAAGRAGYRTTLSYDVDPADYTDPGAGAVASRLLASVRPGSIVSLHLGHAGTVTAMPAILRGLGSRGLRAVTVTELLGPEPS